MNNSVFRINLDIHRQTTQANLSVKKGDTARKIVAALSDGGRPYRIDEGCYAVFMAKKSDGTVLYNGCTIENNCIVYEFTKQTASSAGRMLCELRLYGADNGIITSPRIAIIVSGAVCEDSEVESTDEFTALSRAMADLAALKGAGVVPTSGIVLLDQVTGEAYTLYVVDGQLYIVAGGTAAEGTGSVLLEDHSGGDVYKIYVSDGALMMESEG